MQIFDITPKLIRVVRAKKIESIAGQIIEDRGGKNKNPCAFFLYLSIFYVEFFRN